MLDLLKAAPNNPWVLIAICAIAFWFLSKVFREQIHSLRTERDDKSRDLHSERNAHQSTKLKLAELENRPNLVSVESLLREYCDTTQRILKSHQDHVADDAKMFASITTATAAIPTAIAEQTKLLQLSLKQMSDAFDERQAKMVELIFTKKKSPTRNRDA